MSKNLKRFLIGFSSALVLYSLLGFLVLPSIALSVINKKLTEYATQPAKLENLKFNPFSLRLNLYQLHLGQEKTTLAFEQLETQLAWDTLWKLKLHIKTVKLTKPNVWLDINMQGEVNLVQLFQLPESNTDRELEKTPTEPLAVHINKIIIEEGQFSFSDQRPRQAVAVEFDQLNLQLDNFSTAPDEQGQLELKLEAKDGTHLAWQGDLSLQPLRSSGSLLVNNIVLSSWWPYVTEQTQLELEDGQVSFSSDYLLEAHPDWQFSTSNSAIEIKQLSLSSKQQPLIKLEVFSITDTAFNLQNQSLKIGKIRSQNLESWIKINQQGQTNWLEAVTSTNSKLISASELSEETPVSPVFEPKEFLAQLPWQIKLASAQLKNYALDFNDLSKTEPVAIKLTQLDFELTNFDSYSDKPTKLKVSSQVGEEGQLALEAQINPQSLQSTLTLNTSYLDLRPAQAWISPYARLELLSGLLTSELSAELMQISPLQANARGELNISQLHLRDKVEGGDLLKWNNLQLQSIAFTQNETTQLKIGQVMVKQPYLRLEIDENLNSNISKIIVAQPSKKQAEIEETKPAETLAFYLGEVLIEEGSAHITDLSLTPNFATAIQNLNGKLSSLDNQKNIASSLEITGSVDRYAPVSIKGFLTPFDPLKKLDVDINFQQIELSNLTPYSGKFVGYPIQKGKLNLVLNYQIEQGKLNANNNLLFEDLQLGEAINSPNDVKLPLRLAVALLKDNKGNIKIKLPIKGDLNNPEFNLMPIVWQTFRNLVTRAVSAPFKLLGSLTNENHDLSQVSYSAGTSSLSEESKQALSSLAQALKQRPELKLNIEGSSSAILDGPLIAQEYLQYRMQKVHYQELQERGKKLPEPIEQLELNQKEQSKLLAVLYQQLPEQKKLAEKLPSNNAEREEFMRQAWIAHNATNTSLLRSLAQNRARNIREYLSVQEQIEAKRLFLLDVNEAAEPDEQKVNSLLHLDVL